MIITLIDFIKVFEPIAYMLGDISGKILYALFIIPLFILTQKVLINTAIKVGK